MGETSGSAIRALSLGKPLVVSDVGWFAELPDDVALKVPSDEREEDDAARRARGARRPGRPRGDGRGARASSSSASTGVDRVAEAYAAALEETGRRRRRSREPCSARSRRPRPRSGIERRPTTAVLAARLREVGLGD